MILIVEDNERNAELLQLFLERKAGIQSISCTDGDRALELCRSGKIRLVIMDIQLNHTFVQGKAVTGVELTRCLKLDPQTTHIIVLLSSAHAMRDQREQFIRDSGAEGYIAKPIENYDALIAEVQKWLKTGC